MPTWKPISVAVSVLLCSAVASALLTVAQGEQTIEQMKNAC